MGGELIHAREAKTQVFRQKTRIVQLLSILAASLDAGPLTVLSEEIEGRAGSDPARQVLGISGE